jgi:hypothetical protein
MKDANVLDRLDPWDKLSDVFPQQPPEDDVHILVKVLGGTSTHFRTTDESR